MCGARDPFNRNSTSSIHNPKTKQTPFHHNLFRVTHSLCIYPHIARPCVNIILPMAGVLETLAVPRATSLPSASLAPVAGSAAYRRSVVRFSEFRGLKIQSSRSSTSPSLASKPAARGGRVVSEAQNTAVVVPAVTDETWQSLVLGSDLPVLVEFWAPWCGPCRIIHPVIDTLAKNYAGKLKCYKVNTDDSPAIATQYGIRSIPTVLIFKDGEKKDAVIGAVPESTLTTCIERFV